jgi:hypothetical protein
VKLLDPYSQLFFRESGVEDSEGFFAALPGAGKSSPDGKAISHMPARSGRLAKRIQKSMPVEISTFQHPPKTERATTENVSSLGVRVLTDRPLEQNERLMIRPLLEGQQNVARVVYCERLLGGRFGVGMQFLGAGVNWPNDSTGPIK